MRVFVVVIRLAAIIIVASLIWISGGGFSASAASVHYMTAAPLATVAETGRVYDRDDNKLYYNRLDGVVYSSDLGITLDHAGMPLVYDAESKTVSNALQERLQFIDKVHGSNYYLANGNYKVASIGIDDTIYVVTVKSNMLGDKPEPYDMLVRRVWRAYEWWEQLLCFFGGVHADGEWEYYDLYNGHYIDPFNFVKAAMPAGLYPFGLGISYNDTIKTTPSGTVRELLEEIVLLDEQIDDDPTFARHPVNSEVLRDDRNQKIRVSDNGQLVDPMLWPLVGSDARPLYYDRGHNAYLTHSGELLTFNGAELVDSDGFVAHSVISNVIAGQQIYIIYLADGVTRLPATGLTKSVDPFVLEFYDLNGNLIIPDEIIPPDVSEDDRRDKFPGEFPDEESLWDWMLGKLAEFVGEMLAPVFSFFSEWGMLIILALALLLTAGLWFPLLLSLLGPLLRGVFVVLSIVVMAPFKFLARLFGGKK